MYLQKSITTGFGIEASVWALSKIEISGGKAMADLSLYASPEAENSSDNISLAEPIEPQIYNKVVKSSLSEDGEEQNVYSTSHSCIVSFQDVVFQTRLLKSLKETTTLT
jgi:hypothetical protein